MKQIFQHYCSFIEWQYEIFDSSQCPLKKLLYGLSDHRSNFFFFFFFSLTLSSHASFYVFFGWCVREKEERKCLSLSSSRFYTYHHFSSSTRWISNPYLHFPYLLFDHPFRKEKTPQLEYRRKWFITLKMCIIPSVMTETAFVLLGHWKKDMRVYPHHCHSR